MNPFGLNIQSVISLPGYADTGKEPDVMIRYGTVPDALPCATMIRACTQTRPGQFLLKLDHIAKYLVENGNCITIDPAPDVTDDDVRLFLMGSAWSALLLQRGLLPLHGSAIRVKDSAIVLAGPTGNGKSTLAAALMEQGFSIIADELCGLVVQEGHQPMLMPGFPQILLWEDTLEKMGKDIRKLSPVRPGMKKFILPLGNANTREPLPLDQVYILVANNIAFPDIIPLRGVNKIHALMDCTYRAHHVAGLGLSMPHFNQCSNAAHGIVVKQVDRPEAFFDINDLARRLMEDF